MNDKELIERLSKFLTYEKDWDSYGADPFDPEMVELGEEWVKAFPNFFTFVAPTGAGTWQLEYEKGDVFLEFGPDLNDTGNYWFLSGKWLEQGLAFDKEEEDLRTPEVVHLIKEFQRKNNWAG